MRLQWLSPQSCREPGIAPPPFPNLVYGAATVERRKVNGVTESEAVSAFDSRGRLLSRELSTPTRVGVAEYAWTGDGELAELHTQWNGGSWRGLRYDRAGAEGELTAVSSFGGGAYASVSGRDALGRITQVELADGTLVERGYDLLGRVERASAMRGTGDLREQVYSYDHRGRGPRWRAQASPSGPTRETREGVRHSTCRGAPGRVDDGDRRWRPRMRSGCAPRRRMPTRSPAG